MSSIASILTAVGLGAGAGVNAYATLLVFGLLSRWNPSMFGGHSDLAKFFASTPVLITLGVLYTIEFVADKVPAIDHAWDVIHTFIRPAAGAVAGFAAISSDVPQGVAIFAGILAGGAALTTHFTKATVRVGSTASTGGTANPVLSIVEDLFAFANAFIALFLPWLVLIVLILLLVFFLLLRRRFRARAAS